MEFVRNVFKTCVYIYLLQQYTWAYEIMRPAIKVKYVIILDKMNLHEYINKN